MNEVMDAYAALKWKFDALEKEYVACDVDFRRLWKFLEGKVTPTNNGKIADYAINYMKQLEDEVKLLSAKPVLSDEGRLELIQANGQG